MTKCTTPAGDLVPDKLIRNIPFFACLSDEEFAGLKHILRAKRYSKGRLILSEDATQYYMYIVGSGKVKAVHYGDDGKEHILSIHKRGDFFGEMSLLDGKTAPAAVVAMEDTAVALLGKKDFDMYLLKNGKVLKELTNLLCSRLREAWMMLRVLSLPDAEERVKAALGLMGRHYGIKSAGGTRITIKLTHQDIADYSSVARETVTRLLNRLAKLGDIEILDDRSILLRSSFSEKTLF